MHTTKEKLEKYKQETIQNAEIERISEEITDKTRKLATLKINRQTSKGIIKDYLTRLNELKDQLKKEKNFFTSLKNLGNKSIIDRINKDIDYYTHTIEEETKKLNDTNAQIKKLEEEIQTLESSIESKKLSENIFKLDETGKLIIDISKRIPEGLEQNNENVMVHVTGFFPKNHTIVNNYNGNRTGEVIIGYQGVKTKVTSLVHRHTVHFTLNNVVHSTGDGAGSWGNEKYIVLEPLKNHTNDNIRCLNMGDSWIYGDIHFGDDSILLVRKEAYKELSDEVKNSYNIILFEGNSETNVRKILRQFGYPVFNTIDAQDFAGHRESLEYMAETVLEDKNEAINYMTDNRWDGKSKIILNEEEIATLFRILKNGKSSYQPLFSSFNKVLNRYNPAVKEYEENNKVKINIEVLRFILGTGLYKTSDGNYSFKTDDEIYKIILGLEETKDYKIDFQLYEEIMKILEKHIRTESPLVPLDNNIPLSNLTSFKYHNMARSFVNELNAIINKYNFISKGGIALSDSYGIVLNYIDKGGIVLTINIGDNLYDFIDGNYEIHNVEHDDSNNCLNYIIKLNGNTAEEVLEQTHKLIKIAQSFFKQTPPSEKNPEDKIDMDMSIFDIGRLEYEEEIKINQILREKIASIVNIYQIKVSGYPEKSYAIEMPNDWFRSARLSVKVGREVYDFIKDSYRIEENNNEEYNEFADPYKTYEVIIDAKTIGEALEKIEELAKTASKYISEKNKTSPGKNI